MTVRPAIDRNRTSIRRRGPVQIQFDFPLLAVVAALLGLGLVMIFSASYAQAADLLDQSTYYFAHQLRWLAIGAVVMSVAALIDYRFWRRFSIVILIGTVALLFVVLIFAERNLGARRQLINGSLQPSEFAKLALTFYIAYWLTSKGDRLRNVPYGLLPFAVLLGLVAGLIMLQPDIDTTVIIVMTALVMFFIAGADGKQLVASLTIVITIILLAVTKIPYANQRLNDYLAGLKDLASSSDHARSAVLALASGGWLGEGLGSSRYKYLGGVPLPWSDSIFAIIGEELGLVGALVVIGLFLILGYRGLRIAWRAEDRFGMVLACGITTWLCAQAFVNIAVNTATLPFSGMTLPFVSYGGSSLVATLAAVGILLSISRYANKQPAPNWLTLGAAREAAPAPRVRRRHWWSRISRVGRPRRAGAQSRSATRSRQPRSAKSGMAAATWKAASVRSVGRTRGKPRRRASRQYARATRAVGWRSATRRATAGSAGRRVPRRR